MITSKRTQTGGLSIITLGTLATELKELFELIRLLL